MKKNIQVNLPLRPVITKKQLKNTTNQNLGVDININSLLTKKLDPISAPKKVNTNVLTSSLQRKPSARSEKVMINCEESTDIKGGTEKKKNNKNVKKPVKKTINISKSLGSFNLFDNNNIPDEEGSVELI